MTCKEIRVREIQINEIVEHIFKKELYCEAVESAKERVTAAFLSEYEKLSAEYSEIQSIGILLGRYGTVKDAAVFAGYTAEQIAEWQVDRHVSTKKEIAHTFRKVRAGIYVGSLSAVFMAVSIVNLILHPNLFWSVNTAAYVLVAVLCGIFVCKNGEAFRYQNICLDVKAEHYIKKLSDQYFKRMINSIGVAVTGLFCLIYIVIISVLKMGMNLGEVFSSIYSAVFLIELVVYAMIKNMVCAWWIGRAFPANKRRSMTGYSLRMILISLFYWSLCALLIFLFRNKAENLFGIFSSMVAAYGILCIVANLTVRQNYVFRNLHMNIRRAAVIGFCLFLTAGYQLMQVDRYLLQPYISTVSRLYAEPDLIEYDDNSGVYTITTDKEEFRILQLTDIHLGGSLQSAGKDYQALTACYRLIEHTRPDLVIVTGDLVFPLGVMSFSLNNTAPMTQFASFMRNIGVPWAFTYGNHDTESLANATAWEVNELFKSLSFKTSGNLLYPYTQPDITGRNNQLIEIRNADGSLNQALFLLDSNDYINGVMNDYDYIHDDQVDWYRSQVERLNEQEGELISSLLFFHMPLQEYRTAYELYEAGSSEVQYFFGDNREKMIDKVCCSEYPSRLFPVAKELGSTKAMFCGHDHYNNLSVAYDGIRLTYGMSIDYLAMPGIEEDTWQRGGTLITLHRDSAYEIEQIRLTDLYLKKY